MLNLNQISKIGIGSWGIGGYWNVDKSIDYKLEAKAITESISLGINYITCVPIYAKGYSAKILTLGISQARASRNKIFLNLSLYKNGIETIADLDQVFNEFLDIFNTDYFDSIQLTMELVMWLGFEVIDEWIKVKLKNQQIRYVGLVNGNREFLKKFHDFWGTSQFSHEICFNFEIRVNQDLGISNLANQLGVKNIVYQPLRRNKTSQRNWPILVDLAKKYNVSQNQIILKWLIDKGFLPIVKSTNLTHIKENLEADLIELSAEDFVKIDNFRVPNFEAPMIKWHAGVGRCEIAELPDLFDSIYDQQLKASEYEA